MVNIFAVIFGVILGIFYKNLKILENIDLLISLGLYLLLFFVGIDIGSNRNIFTKIKNLNKKILLLPFITILGTLTGGFLCAKTLNFDYREGISVACGLGWYSYSAIELSRISAHLGGVAFLSNVFREVFSIFFIPFISKKIGSYEAVSVAGATAMDSTLPIINKNNDSSITIIAFYSGLVITVLIPFLFAILIETFF